jgi:acyl-CoA synthetase (AMP-forming)/AMP-acid ligase II
MNKERSLGEIFSEIAQANSNRPALIFPDRTFTFDQLSKMVQSFALKFREAGCGESLSVQLLASDQLIQLAGVIASSVIGAGLVLDPIAPENGRATKCFVDNPNATLASDGAIVIDESWSPAVVLPALGPLIESKGSSPDGAPWLTVMVMRETGPEAIHLAEKVVLSRISEAGSDYTEKSQHCSLSALTSLTFLTRALAVLCRAGAVVAGRDPEFWREVGVTRVSGSPGEFAALLGKMQAHQRFQTAEIVDAQPTEMLARNLLQHFEALENTYATVEAGVVHVNRGTLCTAGMFEWKGVGPSANVRIVNKSGIEAPVGAVGLIQIRTNASLGETDEPSWMSTHDLGMWGAGGELVVLGRRDDLINVLGRKVPGLAIDQIIASVDGIQRAACFKNPKPDAEDELFAFCIFDEDCNQLQAIASAKYKVGKALGSTFVPRVFRQVGGIPMRPDGRAPERRACAEFVMEVFRQRQIAALTPE